MNVDGRPSPQPDGSLPQVSGSPKPAPVTDANIDALITQGLPNLPSPPTTPVPKQTNLELPPDTGLIDHNPDTVGSDISALGAPQNSSDVAKILIQGTTEAAAQPSTDGIKEKEQSFLGKILSSIISKFTKLVSPKGLKVTQDQVNSFKEGLKALPAYNGKTQTENVPKLKDSIHGAMDTNYTRTTEGATLDHGKKPLKGISWDPSSCEGKPKPMKITGTTSTGETRTVEITPAMQEDQQKNTKIYITKGSQLEGDDVKEAATHGAPQAKRELMQDRTVVSPVYIFADGNGNMHEGEPVRAIMVVQSAQDVSCDSRFEQTTKKLSNEEAEVRNQAMDEYETKIQKETNDFIMAGLKGGANLLVDCGFGQGAFVSGADKKKTNEVFARMWVAEMVAAIKKNPKLVEVTLTHGEPTLIEAVREELKKHPNEAEKITFSDKMTIDVTHHAAKKGLTPAFRLAGDSSGVMGQYATQAGKMKNIAQDEAVYSATSACLQNVHLQKAKVIRNA